MFRILFNKRRKFLKIHNITVSIQINQTNSQSENYYKEDSQLKKTLNSSKVKDRNLFLMIIKTHF